MVENLSVILQVKYFKSGKKKEHLQRVFKRAPIHDHFRTTLAQLTQQYFYSQYISYILKEMEDLETYTLPDFDGAIAEYDQKKKQEQSGN